MSAEVRLRDVDTADLEVFFENEHDSETVRRSKFAPRDRDEFFTHWATRVLASATTFVQTVTVDGAVAGHVESWWEADRRYVGYVFGRQFWGRGVATQALTQFLAREPVRPLYADPYAGNVASIRLLEKCGSRRTGTVEHGADEHVVLVLGAT